MWRTVHVLYQKGRRISADAVKAHGVYGWLQMRSHTPVVRMPKCEAFLLKGPDESPRRPLPYLEHCALGAIAGGGIRLAGVDAHLDQ